MDTVIPAAGLGTRLRPVTNDTPKCLVDVGGELLLDRLIRQLSPHVDEIYVVVGKEGKCWTEDSIEAIRSRDVQVVVNEKNTELENAHSLKLGIEHINNRSGVVILDGDVIVKSEILDNLIELEGRYLISRRVAHSDEKGGRIKTKNGIVESIGTNMSTGEFLYSGIMKLDIRGRGALHGFLEESHKTVNAINRLASEMDLFNYDTTYLKNGWVNINNKERLALARKEF